MKRFYLLAIAAMSLMVLAATSCGGKQSAQTDGDAGGVEFYTDSLAWSDSATTTAGHYARCSMSLRWPVKGNAAALDSTRRWIADRLATPLTGNPDDTVPGALPKECLENGQILMSTIGGRVLAGAKAELAGFEKNGNGFSIGYEFDWNISEVYRTDNSVTLGCNAYCYLGGAHGSTVFSAQVFRLTDGKKFGWNMFRPEALKYLVPLVKDGLMNQYFKVHTAEEFRDALLVDADTLPLPVSAPFFSADGVVFTYQQYEIASYSSGMPSCVLPYATVEPMLTEEAKALMP